MNYLALDFGTKKIGLAYSVSGIISTLPVLTNDSKFIDNLNHIIDEYHIEKISRLILSINAPLSNDERGGQNALR